MAQERIQAEMLAPGRACNPRQVHLGLWNLLSFLIGIERPVALPWGRRQEPGYGLQTRDLRTALLG